MTQGIYSVDQHIGQKTIGTGKKSSCGDVFILHGVTPLSVVLLRICRYYNTLTHKSKGWSKILGAQRLYLVHKGFDTLRIHFVTELAINHVIVVSSFSKKQKEPRIPWYQRLFCYQRT